jgi:hypothetical protein
LAVLAGLLLTGPVAAQSPYSPITNFANPPAPIPVQIAQPSAAPAPRTQVSPVRFQPPRGPGAGGVGRDGPSGYQVQVEPPGLEKLAMSVMTDGTLHERIRQETRERDPNEVISFPAEPVLSDATYGGRGNLWPHRELLVEPDYVCHGKLLFQDRNAERYGWDLGVLQPVVSTGLFMLDFCMLPYNLAVDPCHCTDCSRGYCLPGDPVPFLLYPPDISLTGAAAEFGTIMALVAIFP